MTADFAFVNGRVRTVDATDRIVQAVATSGRQVLAVGSDREIRALVTGRTEVVDLKGREVTPGFNDAHHHFGAMLARYIDCQNPAIQSIGDIVAAVAREATGLPEGAWIRGKGYNHRRLDDQRHPTRWDLDPVSPRHPVVLMRTCGHIGVANSRALEVMGLDDTSADPPGGHYDRSDGRLSGVLFERALYPVVRASSAARAELEAEVTRQSEVCLRMGWTTLQDPGVRNAALIPALIAAERAGRLPVRIRAFAELAGMEPHGVSLVEAGIASGFGNERLRIGPCKFMVDGSSSGPTAATRAPYVSQPDFSGFLQMSQDELDTWVLKARRQDFQVTMHAVGDRAIEMCLDAFARADSRVPSSDPRHRIEHCAMCPPDLVKRVRAQRIIPVVQPTFLWDFGEGYVRDYGAGRGAAMFPLRSFLDAGVVVAGSTDSPVSRREPLFGIQQAVTRRTRQGEVCDPGQRVTVAEAVRMFTYGSAYATGEEGALGSLEPGKLADLVVLERGLEDGPAESIGEISVDLTMVDGAVVTGRG